MLEVASLNLGLQLAGRLRDEGSRFGRLVQRLLHRPEDPAPGNWQSRSNAYRRFAASALVTSQDLQLLSAIGTPPRLLGAIWSWPTAFRVIRRVGERFSDTLTATVEISIVGDNAVLEAAGAAGEALADLAAAFPNQRDAEAASVEFSQRVDSFNERLAAFTTAARRDLRSHN